MWKTVIDIRQNKEWKKYIYEIFCQFNEGNTFCYFIYPSFVRQFFQVTAFFQELAAAVSKQCVWYVCPVRFYSKLQKITSNRARSICSRPLKNLKKPKMGAAKNRNCYTKKYKIEISKDANGFYSWFDLILQTP